MKVVVTGGAGFIGANLCARLLQDGVGPVVAFDDLSTGSRDNLSYLDDVELVEASILDEAKLKTAIDGSACVVHLAARPSVPRSLADPVATHEANATGTLRLLQAARAAGVGHVVVASSSSVYGANPTLPKSEDMATLPLSPYAASKLATEAYALSYAHSFGLQALAFRFFNVFGPLQPAGHAYAAVIPAFVDAALDGRALTIHGDGLQTRDFTYVGTVAAVLSSAVRGGVSSPGPVNLAFGSRLSLLEVVSALEKILDRSLRIEHVEARPGDVRHSQADGSRLHSLFSSELPVPFEVGLAETVAWFEHFRRGRPGARRQETPPTHL
ncbi:MAG: NAD-dependent epimerase/dehydratase family protein [Acidimicrobiales bacterium]